MAELPRPKKNYAVDNRWTAELVAEGFTPVSVFFLDNYAHLSPPITHSEAMLIVHLVRYKWSDEAPYPGFKTIAKQMGISPQMTRHHARSLSEKGYLHREIQVGSTNRFHLQPLFEALSKLRKRDAGRAASQATVPEASIPPAPPPATKPPLPKPPPPKPPVLLRKSPPPPPPKKVVGDAKKSHP